MFSARLEFDERLVNKAVWAFWRKSMGVVTFVGIPLAVVMLIFQIADGDRSWVVGLFGGITLLAIGLPVFTFTVHYRNSMAKFRELKDPVASFTADEDHFTLSSDRGTSTFLWGTIIEVWRFDGFWLLLFSKAQFVTIPLANVSEEMKAYVIDRVTSAGGRVAG